jgi:hypothetical protein
LFGLIGLGAGMMFGTVPTSIPEIILFANWLFEGRFKSKWHLIRLNPVFWVLSSVLLMHVLGLIHTGEMSSALDDIRIKIPLLLLPLVFFTTEPVNKNEFNLLLKFFVVAVVMSTLWCVFYYFTHDLSDARKASRFMSHIRLGLLVNFCVGVLYFLFRNEDQFKLKTIYVLIIVYLLAVMLILGMVTGLSLFVLLAVIYMFYLVFRHGIIFKLTGLILLSVLAISGFFLIGSEWKKFNYVDMSEKNNAKTHSQSGRAYFKLDSANYHTENGFYITNNIQYDELHMHWKKYSKINLYGQDKKGAYVMWNVIRYLSSKGLTKDSVGLAELGAEDFKNIENGCTNYLYANASPIKLRIKEFFWEYRDYKQGFNPSGNTLLMRLEFWKAAKYIIARNLWTGVGTGDAQKSFNKAYNRSKSTLAHEWWLRSHNQFLSITVCFGIWGLLVFLFSIVYPAISLRNQLNNLYWLFLLIVLISFITEDTLETQTGVTFYAYFNTLFLWLACGKKYGDTTNQNL